MIMKYAKIAAMGPASSRLVGPEMVEEVREENIDFFSPHAKASRSMHELGMRSKLGFIKRSEHPSVVDVCEK